MGYGVEFVFSGPVFTSKTTPESTPSLRRTDDLLYSDPQASPLVRVETEVRYGLVRPNGSSRSFYYSCSTLDLIFTKKPRLTLD